MKPYFNYFRNFYPLDQSLFYVAHWWHPAVYEAQMAMPWSMCRLSKMFALSGLMRE
jgi:hypothetical protein